MFEQPAAADRHVDAFVLPTRPLVSAATLRGSSEWEIIGKWSDTERALAYRHWRSRTSVLRDLHLDRLHGAERMQEMRDVSIASGVTGQSVFDDQLPLDVTLQLPRDILHVIFEGGLLFHLKYLLGVLRDILGHDAVAARISWLSAASSKIACFGRLNPYFVGQLEKFCDPQKNSKCGLRGVRAFNLPIHPCYADHFDAAVDIATLGLLFPAAFGDYISAQGLSAEAALLSQHLNIVRSILQFSWTEAKVLDLASNIDRFHDAYVRQLGVSWWRPKLHSYLHLPVDILRYDVCSTFGSPPLICSCRDICLY